MRTRMKSDLLRENAEISAALNVRDCYLTQAFRGDVTFISKGAVRLGICAETHAHGGVVLEAHKDNPGNWYVVGVHYWEEFSKRIREYPFRHDDYEGLDLRTCVEQVQKHVSAKQAAFYAPKVAEACRIGGAS